MGGTNPEEPPSRRDIFEASLSGAQERPWIPRLRSDQPLPYHPLPRSLERFREEEGLENRDKRLQEVWKKLPHKAQPHHDQVSIDTMPIVEHAALTKDRAEKLTRMYEDELLMRVAEEEGSTPSEVNWDDFKRYAEEKEAGMYYSLVPVALTLITLISPRTLACLP